MKAILGSPRLTSYTDWTREHQLKKLRAGGFPRELAEAIVNLLELYSMETYQGGNSGREWRVQYQRHAFRFTYLTIVGDWSNLHMWINICREVEVCYGHIP